MNLKKYSGKRDDYLQMCNHRGTHEDISSRTVSAHFHLLLLEISAMTNSEYDFEENSETSKFNFSSLWENSFS